MLFPYKQHPNAPWPSCHVLSIKRFVNIISSLLFDCLVIKKEDKSLKKELMSLWTKRSKRHEENAKKTKTTGTL